MKNVKSTSPRLVKQESPNSLTDHLENKNLQNHYTEDNEDVSVYKSFPTFGQDLVTKSGNKNDNNMSEKTGTHPYLDFTSRIEISLLVDLFVLRVHRRRHHTRVDLEAEESAKGFN